MPTVAIVFHSGFGHTRVQAEAVAAGAGAVPGTDVHLLAVDQLAPEAPAWDHLDAADAIVFGTPTYMGGPSAPFKAFLDATSPRWAEQRWRDKLAAGFTNSAGLSGDKVATLQQLAVFAAQHAMVWVSLGLLPGAAEPGAVPTGLNRLAGFLGAMAQSNAEEDDTTAPPVDDRRTAEHLGRRVAEAAQRWRLPSGAAVAAAASS